jgi:hypothetical protein
MYLLPSHKVFALPGKETEHKRWWGGREREKERERDPIFNFEFTVK